jgi:GNAT superfamily N-acetyltransferase
LERELSVACVSIVDEILALDLLTLRNHTEQAGDALDERRHHNAIANTLSVSKLIAVRGNGALVAYASLQPQEDGCWFVTGFNTHPSHRSASVFRELFAEISALARQHRITSLRSHVYKTNRLSLAFHRRLGFEVTKENAKAVEFHATFAKLGANSFVERSGKQKELM